MLPIGYGMPPACGLRPAEQVVRGSCTPPAYSCPGYGPRSPVSLPAL